MSKSAGRPYVVAAAHVGLAPTSFGGLNGRLQKALIVPLWNEFDATLLAQAEAITIEELLRRAAKAGIRKRVTEPLNFMI